MSGSPASTDQTVKATDWNSATTRLAHRRDQAVLCDHCGRKVRRKSRHQRFCSRRCRVSAHRAKTFVQAIKKRRRYPPTGDETNASNIVSNSKRVPQRFLGSSPHIRGPKHVIEDEVVAGRDWRQVTSADGIASFVSHLHEPTLVSQ
jgi:hypothetical protein